MGLFSRKKTEEPNPQNTAYDTQNSPAESEFDRDVVALMARDDIQCRQDICDAEYQKALELLEDPTPEKVHRAYDLMGNLASRFDYVPAILWMGDFVESVMGNLKQAAYWYQKAAELGDGNGARCYADMLMTGNGVERDIRLAMHYYADAADKGVPEAAFVVGEYMRNTGDNLNALKAYLQAAEAGYAPAKERIRQMQNR